MELLEHGAGRLGWTGIGGVDGALWSGVKFRLPPLLFRVDFVIEDKNSGAVDNNNGQDFGFELENAPTAEEVMAARVKLLDAFEQEMSRRRSRRRRGRSRLAHAEGGRGAGERRRGLRMRGSAGSRSLQEARDVVAERRSDAAAAAAAGTGMALGIGRRVLRGPRPPAAGSVATLFYNKASGALADGISRGRAGDGGVRRVVDAGHGGSGQWCRQRSAICRASVAKSASVEDGDWVKADVSVWNTAAALDFACLRREPAGVGQRGRIEDYHTTGRQRHAGRDVGAAGVRGPARPRTTRRRARSWRRPRVLQRSDPCGARRRGPAPGVAAQVSVHGADDVPRPARRRPSTTTPTGRCSAGVRMSSSRAGFNRSSHPEIDRGRGSMSAAVPGGGRPGVPPGDRGHSMPTPTRST